MTPRRFLRRIRSQAPKHACVANLLLALGGFVAGACGPQGASPIPQPPIMAVPIERVIGVPPVVDPDRQTLPGIDGPNGSAPPGATVRITNLDNDSDPAEAVADTDGSFTLVAAFNPGEELRFEVLSGKRRSPPADGVVGTAFDITASERFACLTLEPGFLLEFAQGGSSASLRFSSTCADDVVLDNARLRVGTPGFTVQTPLPFTLTPSGSQSVDVALSGQATSGSEDVLFIDVTLAGQTIRYPITLALAR
jgi:hypothetical protein